jgi:hypothetical protein
MDLSKAAFDTWVRSSPARIWFFGQPVSQTRTVGQSVTFGVVSFGSGTIGYRWRRNGQDLDDRPGLTGTHAATLRIAAVTTLDAGVYDARVYNECESVYSNAATLSVPLHRDDAVRALRIAGGLTPASADDRARLDVVGGASSGSVDLSDATRLLRTVMGL